MQVSPSVKACLGSFESMMENDARSDSKRESERLIVDDHVFVAQFRKSHLLEALPDLQPLPMTYQIDNNTSLRYKDDSDEDCLFLLADEGKSSENYNLWSQTCDKFIEISVSRVYRHPTFLFPATQTEADGLGDIWPEIDEAGHQVLGIEYMGYQTLPSKVYSCTNGRCIREIENINGDTTDALLSPDEEIIALYPAAITSTMFVPRQYTVKTKSIKNYIPGLLTTSAVSKALVENILNDGQVLVVTENTKSLDTKICAHMIRSFAQSKLLDIHNGYSKDANIETLVILGHVKVENVNLPIAKHIVCLKSALPSHMQNKLFFDGLETVNEVDSMTVLTKKNITSVMSDLVSWYGEQYDALMKAETDAISADQLRGPAVMSFPTHTPVENLALPFEVLTLDGSLIVKERIKDGFDSYGAYVLLGVLPVSSGKEFNC